MGLIKKLLLLACIMTLLSCSERDPYTFLNPKLPYERPFKFDKAGEKTVVDFWILPEQQKIDGSQSYGVSFLFNHTLASDPSAQLKMLEILVHAQLYLVQGQNLKPIVFKADTQSNHGHAVDYTQTFTEGAGDVYANEYGRGASHTQYVILWFKPAEYGQYRVVLEPKNNNQNIGSIDFKLRVSEINFGK